MQTINDKKYINKNRSLEIVTELYELFSKSPNHGGPPTKHQNLIELEPAHKIQNFRTSTYK